jgi:lysophospholipase L1-like esterase
MTSLSSPLHSALRSPIYSPLVGRWGAAAPIALPTVSTAPQAVYGTTLLVSGYAGKCLQAQRASDNATQDIGFVNGSIDMASAVAFAAGSELTVAKWYDQSGNGNDAVQATAANQPRLRVANAWRGLQGITFDGFAAASGGTQVAKKLAFPAGVTIDRQASTGFTVNGLKASYNSTGTLEIGTTSIRALPFTNVGAAGAQLLTGGAGITGTRWNRMNPSVNGWRMSATATTLYTDTASATAAAQATGTASAGNIGSTASGAQFNLRGEIYAIAIYAAALSDADAALVQAALKSAYGVDYSQAALIVVEGDSISEGTSDTYMMNNIRQALAYVTKDAHVYNMAVHGTTAAIEYPRRVAKFAGLSQAGATKKVVLFGLGSNDINNSTTAATLWTTYCLPYIQYLTGAGFAVVVGTLIPRGAFTAPQETERLAYNQLVRDNAAANGYVVCDYCALPEFDAQSDASSATYYFTDNTHPLTAGYAKMAAVSGPLINTAVA